MHREQMPRENEAKKEEVAHSDPASVAFQTENQYLLLLEVSAAADLIRSQANIYHLFMPQ